ncbi:MAG TPA: ribonuclease P protein component [Chloroflexia bacterium]|jgi:ribonuclease P protein component
METLKRSGQFERVRREGRTWSSRLMVLNAAINGQDIVRCGFIAGKKVGGAVERNRARRLLREALRARLPRIKPGMDLVLIARAPIIDVKLDAVAKELDDLLLRGKLLVPPAETTGAQSRIIGNTGEAASQDGVAPNPIDNAEPADVLPASDAQQTRK